MQGWHLLSRYPHQDRLSNDSDGQIKLDVSKQHHHPLAVRQGSCLLTLRKGSRLSIPSARGNFDQINFLAWHRNLFWQLSRDGNVWFEYVTHHYSLSKTTLQATLEGGQRHGRHKRCWMDTDKEWVSLPMPQLLIMASCRKDWKRISAESSLMFTPTTYSVKGLN